MDLTPEAASRGVRDMLALQSWMCRRYEVERRLARRHRRSVRAVMSRGLIRVSRRSADQGRMKDARRLLAAAYRVYWPALVHRSAARLAARLIRRESAGAS
jgi:hypothetical protein